MDLALYHPLFGYYVRPVDDLTKERIGWSGDFYTSSDVHPILGQALAKQAQQLHARSRPSTIRSRSGNGTWQGVAGARLLGQGLP